MPKYRIKTSEILVHCNPLEKGWDGPSISEQEVREAIGRGVVENRSWQEVNVEMTRDRTTINEVARKFHIERVATLFRTGEIGKICLVIETMYTPPRIYFSDGYHRFAAACLRGDETIELTVSTGEEARIIEIFPSAVFLEFGENDPRRAG